MKKRKNIMLILGSIMLIIIFGICIAKVDAKEIKEIAKERLGQIAETSASASSRRKM